MKRFARSLMLFGLIFTAVGPLRVAGQDATVPQDFVRYVDGETSQALETAIIRYHRGRQIVDLVAVVHLGDEGYFDDLNEHLSQYDAVLYEMVGGEYEDRSARMESGVADPQTAGIQAAHQMIKTMLAMEYQLDGIEYDRINFFHADVTWDEYGALMTSRNQSMATLFQRAFAAAQTGEVMPGIPSDTEGATSMMNGLFTSFASGDTSSLKRTVAPILSGAEGLIQKIEGDDGTVIITERNKVVMRHLENHMKQDREKIAIFYGAGHMRDIGERLKAQGFVEGDVSWMTAWDIQPMTEAQKISPLEKTTRDEELAGAIFNVIKGFMQTMADTNESGK